MIETEFAKSLAVMGREGNTLSAVIREAWDSGHLRVLTKNSPIAATGAYVSIVGHITMEDLKACLSDADVANGFGNRFLWMLAKRSKHLPEGGQVSEKEWNGFVKQLKDATTYARTVEELRRDDEARRRWCEVYESLQRSTMARMEQ